MKRFSVLTIAAAVAAAMTVPVALAQTTGGNATPSTTDGRSGGTGPMSGNPAAQPSTPGTTPSSPSSAKMPSDRQPSAPQRSATDGRSGGTGPMSGTPMPTNKHPGSMAGAETVRDAQEALRDKGFDVGPIDGIVGPRTQAALREFQQKEGLQASGRLDQQTLAALDVETTGGSMSSPSRSNAGPSGAAGSGTPALERDKNRATGGVPPR
jgi:hypothetical protein